MVYIKNQDKFNKSQLHLKICNLLQLYFKLQEKNNPILVYHS
jgi:hypothetical protein